MSCADGWLWVAESEPRPRCEVRSRRLTPHRWFVPPLWFAAAATHSHPAQLINTLPGHVLAKRSLRPKQIPAIFPRRTNLRPPGSPQLTAVHRLALTARVAIFSSPARRKGHGWSIPALPGNRHASSVPRHTSRQSPFTRRFRRAPHSESCQRKSFSSVALP
jgi:hypothetical protein